MSFTVALLSSILLAIEPSSNLDLRQNARDVNGLRVDSPKELLLIVIHHDFP